MVAKRALQAVLRGSDDRARGDGLRRIPIITALMLAGLVIAAHGSRLVAELADSSGGVRAKMPLERVDGEIDSVVNGNMTLITDYGREIFSLRGAKIVSSQPLATGDRIAVYYFIDPATEVFVADSVYRLAAGGARAGQTHGVQGPEAKAKTRAQPDSLPVRDGRSVKNGSQVAAGRAKQAAKLKSSLPTLLSDAGPWAGLGAGIALVVGLMFVLLRQPGGRA